jgi:PD-(D/E)XK endonuclease
MSSSLFLFRRAGHRQMRGRDHGFLSRLEICPGKLETAAARKDTVFRSLFREQSKAVVRACAAAAQPKCVPYPRRCGAPEMCAPRKKKRGLIPGVSLVGAMENSAEVPAGQRAGRDRKGKSQKGTLKQRGELAELGFMFKAAGLGFGVAKPWGDSERYDFILDSGERLWRVQVKSTYVARSPKYSVNACGSSSGKKKSYTAEEIDILVAYIVAENVWYVVPVAAFAPRRRLNFYPFESKWRGSYEKYREAWDLMKADPAHRDLDRSWALGGQWRRERPARAGRFRTELRTGCSVQAWLEPRACHAPARAGTLAPTCL